MSSAALEAAGVTTYVRRQQPEPGTVEVAIAEDLPALGADPATDEVDAPATPITLCGELALLEESNPGHGTVSRRTARRRVTATHESSHNVAPIATSETREPRSGSCPYRELQITRSAEEANAVDTWRTQPEHRGSAG